MVLDHNGIVMPCRVDSGRLGSIPLVGCGPTRSTSRTPRHCSRRSECLAARARLSVARDTIVESRHSNMKELRPGSTGRTEIRVLFAFDLERRAVLLLGGDKSRDWRGWYRANVPIADDRLEEHQQQLVLDRSNEPIKHQRRPRR